jgi:zinc and cadmium transporter
VSYPFINNIERAVLGILLAISASALVYLGASHLLPAVEKENKRYGILTLAAGVLVAAIIMMCKG